jgi:hypothetical protein
MCVNLYQTGAKSTRTASRLSTRKVLIDAGAMGRTNKRPYADERGAPSEHQINGTTAAESQVVV